MTRSWVSVTMKSFALVAAAVISTGAAAQVPFGFNPSQNPYGFNPSQNPYGFNPSQNPYGAPAQNLYGVPAQNPYANPPPPSSNLYVYPSRGQSQEQLARDRYECHNWAVGETGFDPTRSAQPGTVASSPTTNSIGNNLAGAAIQSLGGSLGGGVGGAAANALAGSLSQQQGNVGAVQSQQASSYAQADGYRRAESACLQGRGYTVN